MPSPMVIAIANQKGGVGKTTTAVNLGACLAGQGHPTLIIDLEPQGNASTGVGCPVKGRNATSYDLLAGRHDLAEATLSTSVDNLSLVPSTPDLSSGDIDFANRPERIKLLKSVLSQANGHEYILIDCPPALGLLTVATVELCQKLIFGHIRVDAGVNTFRKLVEYLDLIAL